MGALLGLVQAVLGTANDDLDLVLHVVAQHLIQAEGARHAVNNGEHVGTEGGLQLGVLVEVIEHHAGHSVALKGDHDAHAHAVGGLILNLGNARNLAAGHGLRDIGDEVIRVDLERQLGDHDGLAGSRLLDGGHTAHADGAAAGGVGILDALITHNEASGGEIRALDAFHAGFQRSLFIGVWVIQHPVDGLGQLVKVMRRDIGGHTHGNAARTVHEQVRNAGWQDVWLAGLAIVVGREVHGVLADIAHHLHGQRGELTLRITHCCRAIVTAGAEVTLTIYQRIAHVPGLGQTHQGVIDGDVTVRVELTHGVRDRAGGLHVAALRAVTGIEHRVEDTAVHRFQAIAHLRQGTADDDGHGVVDVTRLHLLINVNGKYAIKKIVVIVTHNPKFYPLAPFKTRIAARVVSPWYHLRYGDDIAAYGRTGSRADAAGLRAGHLQARGSGARHRCGRSPHACRRPRAVHRPHPPPRPH